MLKSIVIFSPTPSGWRNVGVHRPPCPLGWIGTMLLLQLRHRPGVVRQNLTAQNAALATRAERAMLDHRRPCHPDCSVPDHSRKFREAFPNDANARFLGHDRDTTFDAAFGRAVEAFGLTAVRTAPRSRWQNEWPSQAGRQTRRRRTALRRSIDPGRAEVDRIQHLATSLGRRAHRHVPVPAVRGQGRAPQLRAAPPHGRHLGARRDSRSHPRGIHRVRTQCASGVRMRRDQCRQASGWSETASAGSFQNSKLFSAAGQPRTSPGSSQATSARYSTGGLDSRCFAV